MKAAYGLVIVLALTGVAWGAGTQTITTPSWRISYRGAGQLSVQQSALLRIEPEVDGSLNFTHWLLAGVPTNLLVYGVADPGHIVIWLVNGDAKGILLIKPNPTAAPPAVQYFSLVCSNSRMKRIAVKLDANTVFGTGVPLAGPTWSPFAGALARFGMMFCDGDVETMSFNCDLWGTVLYAKSIKNLRLRNTYLSCILAGTPTHRAPVIVAGSVTNNDVLVFGGGRIGSIVARRIVATPIVVGSTLLDGNMDEMPGVYAVHAPGGPIGVLKADELRGIGMYSSGRWKTTANILPNPNTMVLSSGIGRLRVRRVVTANTSVYIRE
jgi:hypothetical protein